MAASRPYNLLALSDLHLGSDLVHHVRPEAPARSRASERCDRELVGLFDWYREHRVEARPWRLIIGGDFIDFAGMSVMTDERELRTPPTEEERSHGLGGTPDHTLLKLRLVLTHHASVMQGLARFLAAGNTLVIVQGNHDVDWHWRSVQREFRRALEKLAPVPPDAVTFAPWFYYEEGLVYLEHGHQYDPCCSYENVLYPVSREDPRRTARSLADVLLRYVVRPTRGMTESGHDDAGFFDYIRFTVGLGARGAVALAARFARANRVLLRLWRLQLYGVSKRVKAVHRRRMRILSNTYQVSLKQLHRLARLQRAPATRSLAAIVTSVMLDRVLLFTFAVLLTAALLVAAPWKALLAVVPLTLAAGLVARSVLPKRTIAPSAMLRERSLSVAKLFPAAFVVMGHTHLPEMRTHHRTTYVNLGAWGEEDAPDGSATALPATRTHLVVLRAEDGVMAELRTWRTGGPEPFEPTFRKDTGST
jgi:UDP-2,3-diacylglucosamine pyrophosphatase LpxH